MSINYLDQPRTIKDLDNDEPTQFMLKIMETRINRYQEKKKNKFFSFFNHLASPWGMVLFLVITCPGLATVLTLISFDMANALYDLYFLFFKYLVYTINAMLVIFSLKLLALALTPVPIKGGMLDIKPEERLMLSNIMGDPVWKYLTYKLELLKPINVFKRYLVLISLTLVIFFFIALINDGRDKIDLDNFINLMRLIILTFVINALIINGMRINIALKHIMFNLGWNIFTQQLIAFVWIIFWGILGFAIKYAYFYESLFVIGSDVTISLLVYFIFIGLFIGIIVYHFIQTFKQTKYTFSSQLISSLTETIKNNFLLVLALLLGLMPIVNSDIYLIENLNHANYYLKITDYEKQLLINFVYTLILLLIAHYIIKWFKQERIIQKLSPKHILFYIFGTISIVIIKILTPKWLHFNYYNVFLRLADNFISILMTMPSFFIILDYPLKNILEFSARMLSLTDLILAYLFAWVFPGLFASVMELIAFKKLKPLSR